MQKIIITGGAGFVGTELSKKLLAKGYHVHILDRSVPRIVDTNLTSTICDTATVIDSKDIDGAYGIINLAGRTIAGRWTEDTKKEIYESRINTTHNLVEAISTTSTRPSVLVSASAVGYYGNTEDKDVDESAPSGTDFLAHVCVDWEKEALTAEQYGIRVACARTAHVIGTGGLLASLEKVFKIHLGGYFGNGSQYMPWVSLDDLLAIYIFLLENPQAHGPYNTASSTPITQKEFMKVFARTRKYWPVWRIPAFALRLILGEFSSSLLSGQKVTSEKLKQLGFIFAHTELKDIL